MHRPKQSVELSKLIWVEFWKTWVESCSYDNLTLKIFDRFETPSWVQIRREIASKYLILESPKRFALHFDQKRIIFFTEFSSSFARWVSHFVVEFIILRTVHTLFTNKVGSSLTFLVSLYKYYFINEIPSKYIIVKQTEKTAEKIVKKKL